MKVIIIGGGGFVGKSISQKLKQRLGVKVVSLSRSSTPSFDITISPSQEVRDTFKHSNLVINCTGILYSSGGNTFDAVQVQEI